MQNNSKRTGPLVAAVASIKGGVGKTSLAVLLARRIGEQGRRALLVDLDPQASATDYALRDENPDTIRSACSFHLLTERAALADVSRPALLGADVVPAAPILATTGAALAGDAGALLRFRRALLAGGHDVIVMDCPPSLSPELRAGLYAADVALVPVGVDRWTLQGLQVLTDETAKIADTTGRPLSLLAVPSIVTPREDDRVRAMLDGFVRVTAATVHKSASVRRAMDRGTVPGPATLAEIDALAGELIGGM